MEGLQMPLFDCGEVVPSDAAVQADRVRRSICDDAKTYGQVIAAKCSDYQALGNLLNGFADGMAIAYGLDAQERELLRNYAFAGADPVMQAKQH
jgi:hypothetical protein